MSMDHHTIPVAIGRPLGTEAGQATHPAQAARGAEALAEARAVFTPLIDIHEGPEGLVLEADLPGASEGDITIQLEDNVLSLHAKTPAPAPEGARPLYEEYQVSDYYRSFILSDEVDRSRITADLKNGVLRLSLPKAERAKTRRIEIKS
jgi:HSP20 family molecular chaperone IbpA